MTIVTAELLMAGQSPQGGHTAQQLAILGIPWPPRMNWQERVLGKEIADSDAAKFMALRSQDAEPVRRMTGRQRKRAKDLDWKGPGSGENG